MGRERLDTFLERVTSFHADIRWMNSALPRDAVVCSEYAGPFYLQRRSIWLDDGFQGFVDWENVRDVEDLRRALRGWGDTHLFLASGGRDTTADPPAAPRRTPAGRCGPTIDHNRAATAVTSALLGRREPATVSVVALGDCL
jgi:hypothetical protein